MSERRTQWEQFPDIMRMNDLLEITGWSKETAQKAVHTPSFPKYKVHGGRVYIFPKSALIEHFHNQALGI